MSQTKFSDAVVYSKDHEWITLSAPHRVGISDFAQEQLGDLTFAELPAVGDKLKQGAEFGTLESIKAVSPLFSPVDGTVVAVNSELGDDPALTNIDPYGKGWLLEIALDDPGQLDGLMDAKGYADFLASEGH